MAIGAIAGGEMILSHVDGGQASVAALVAPAQALDQSAPAAQLHAQPIVDSAVDSGAPDRLGAAVHSSMNEPAAPSTEVGPSDASAKVAPPPALAAPATKIRRVARHVEPTVAHGGYGAWGWGGSR
jgi:hypothetical protein